MTQPHNAVLLYHKQEQSPDTWQTVTDPRRQDEEWKEPDKTDQLVPFHFSGMYPTV